MIKSRFALFSEDYALVDITSLWTFTINMGSNNYNCLYASHVLLSYRLYLKHTINYHVGSFSTVIEIVLRA
jgi:hypothetical protein